MNDEPHRDPQWRAFVTDVTRDIARQSREQPGSRDFDEVLARVRRLRETGTNDISGPDLPRHVPATGWLLAVAAAALLLIGWGVRGTLGKSVDQSRTFALSQHAQQPGAPLDTVAPRASATDAHTDDPQRVRLQTQLNDPTQLAVPKERAPDPSRDLAPSSETATSDRPAKRRSRGRPRTQDHDAPQTAVVDDAATADERLRELDRRAQATWRSGDKQAAEKLFRTIIQIGRHTNWAQLAYGDLFTLRRQLRDDAGESRLWREYLQRFPHGIHADEARAGLCRRAAPDLRAPCWSAYLSDFPTGSYRAQAPHPRDRQQRGTQP
ncbi:MAG: hypothetical protein V3V08_09950 [Nannocystaceae bacterium]